MNREKITLNGLQEYIRSKDHRPELYREYFFKLVEEVGELSEVIRKDCRMENGIIKGTIEEELCDTLYYILALANIYDINLETCFWLKEVLNDQKYSRTDPTGANPGENNSRDSTRE